MNIVTPLSCVENYERLVAAGADEFFCGYNSHQWLEKFANIVPMNRREYLLNANICSLEEMKILGRMVEEYKHPVKITFNSLFYLREQYDEVVRVIKELMQLGFDTFIIADLALIMYLKEQHVDCKVHLSGETCELNRYSMDMFQDLNITRFVFHRKNSVEDIRSCIANYPDKKMEYEAFMLNELCPYTGAFCNSWHCDEMAHVCKIPFRVEKYNTECSNFAKEEKNMRVFNRVSKINQHTLAELRNTEYRFGATGCGVCKIFELEKAGVGFVKVVGRGKDLNLIEKDIKILRRFLDATPQFKNGLEYEKQVKSEVNNGHCNEFCYYR